MEKFPFKLKALGGDHDKRAQRAKKKAAFQKKETEAVRFLRGQEGAGL
jgi:hypothetical protein